MKNQFDGDRIKYCNVRLPEYYHLGSFYKNVHKKLIQLNKLLEVCSKKQKIYSYINKIHCHLKNIKNSLFSIYNLHKLLKKELNETSIMQEASEKYSDPVNNRTFILFSRTQIYCVLPNTSRKDYNNSTYLPTRFYTT